MPCHSLVSSLIDPAHPLDIAKHTPDVSEQRTHKPVHFKVEDLSPLSYKCHVLPHDQVASATHILTISHSIGPMFGSIDASSRISLENHYDRESDHGNIVNESSIIASHHDHPMPHAVSISPLMSQPRRTTDRRSCRYQLNRRTCRSDHSYSISVPTSCTMPLP